MHVSARGDLSSHVENFTAQAEAARNPSVEIHGGLLARNTVLNLVGQVIPLLVGLATIPYVVRGLGSEGFGILSIAWVLLGYFSLFDLGLGRATTKFVAEALGRGELDRLPGLVWTSLGTQLIFGVVGSLVLGAFVPVLVDRILKISPSFVHETKLSFWLLAASLPIVLATTTLRSILEAAQRFDLVNYVRIPANSSVFLLPAFALAMGLHLPGMILLLMLSRLAVTLTLLFLCLRVFPILGWSLGMKAALLRPLLSYGGWVTISNIVNPLLVYADRFMIGSLLSVAQLGYYTAPFEGVTRLWLVPSSVATTLFPAFSTLAGSGTRSRIESIYSRSVKYMLLILGPPVLLIMAFARDILEAWLGADFALKGTLVLQILAVGVLANSFAYVPFSLLQGLGRPDVVAKLMLWELPFYLGVAYLFITRYGIKGAAIAWSVRVGLEALLLMGLVWKVLGVPLRGLVDNGVLRGVTAFLALAGVVVLRPFVSGDSWVARLAFCALSIGVFAWAVWRHILDDTDRGRLLAIAGPILPKPGS